MKRNIFILGILLAAIAIGAVLWLRQPQAPVSRKQPEPQVPQAKTETPVISTPAEQTVTIPQITAPAQPEQQKKAEPVLLRFAPNDGQTLVYMIEMRSDSMVDFGFLLSKVQPGTASQNKARQGEKSAVTMRAWGALCLKFHEVQPGSWNVAAFTENFTFLLNNTKPGYAKALEFPFAFRMNAGGYLSDFQFTEGIPHEAREFIRQTMYTLQTGLPSEAKTSWKTKENDVNGNYQAEYTVEDTSEPQFVRLNKRKLEYLSVSLWKNIPDSRIHMEKSGNRITVPRQGAWFLTLEGEESSTSSSGDYEWGKSSSWFSVRQISKDVSARFPDTFDKFLAELNAQKFKKSKYYTTEETFNQLGEGLDLGGALAKYTELKNSGISNANLTAEKFLMNYLRQNPQVSFDLVEALDKDPRQERFDQNTQLIFWRLMTMAGHSESQQAVIEAASNEKFSNLTHIRALAYIHDFENPEPFLVEKLWEMRRNLPENPENKDVWDMKTMSLYAIGSLGHKDKLNDEIKPQIGKQLTDNLKNTENPAEQAATLSAIGNYGSSEVLEDIAPFFSSSDERIRASAYDALRRMDSSQAVDLLAKSVKSEQSVKVREMAYTTFAAMPPTSASIDWAKKEIFAVENPKEQEALVKVLGENLKAYPGNEQVLRQLLLRAPDNRVKKEIYKYIQPLAE